MDVGVWVAVHVDVGICVDVGVGVSLGTSVAVEQPLIRRTMPDAATNSTEKALFTAPLLCDTRSPYPHRQGGHGVGVTVGVTVGVMVLVGVGGR